MSEDPLKKARHVAAQLDRHGHARHAAHLRDVLRESHTGATLLAALREACQTVLTAVEAIDPVSALMVDELRLEIDKRIGS